MASNNNKVEIEVAASVSGTVEIDKLNHTITAIGPAGSTASTGAKDATTAITAIGTAAKTSATHLDSTSKAAQDSAASFSTIGTAALHLNQVTSLVGNMVSTLGGIPAEVLKTADSYNNLAARIKLVTGEGAAFESAFAGIKAVAAATSTSLEATGTLFTKLAQAGKEMGIGQAQALALTQTVNQAIQLSGSSAQASDAAVTQLIQGLQGGALRGDEFNSVMEQSPRLAQALADGLGTTTAALRKLAEEGALSSDVVIKALQNQADTVSGEFNKLPPTVGRALTQLSNSWTIYVGETDKASGASTAAAAAITALAENLKTISGYLIDAGQAALAYTAYKLADNFLNSARAAKITADAVATSTTAAIANTAATASNTTALIANKIERDALGLAINKLPPALAGNAAALTSMGAALAATSTRYGENKTQMAAMGAELAATSANTTAAAAEVGTMSRAMTGIGAVATSAFGVAGTAAKGFASLLGGIPGIALLILSNVKDIGTWMGEFVAKHTEYGGKLQANEAALAALANKEKAAAQERLKVQDQLNAASDKAVKAQADAHKAAQDYIPVIEKQVKVTEEQASATLAIVKVSGDEVAIRKTSAEQAQLVADARDKEALASQALVGAIQAQINAIKDQAAASGKLTTIQKTQIADLEKLLIAKTQDADKSAAAASAARTEAADRAILSDAYKDNSGKAAQYSQDLVNAQAKLEILSKSGVASLGQISAAQLQVNVATAKYKDAIEDTITQSKLAQNQAQADIAIAKSLIDTKVSHNSLLIKEATLRGDVLAVQKLEIQGKQLIIDQIKLEITSRTSANTAALEQNAIARKLIDSSTDHGKQQLKELDISDQLIKARQALNLASNNVVKGLEKEIEASKNTALGMLSLVDAYKQLGIQSPQELAKVAKANSDAWAAIKNDATASVDTLKSAFQAYADSALKASGEVGSAQRKQTEEVLKTEASVKNLSVAFDETGKMIVSSMTAGGSAIKGATGYMDVFTRAANEATAALEAQNAATEKGIAAQEKANDLKQRAIDLENKRRNMDKEGWALNSAGERIVEQQETRRSIYEKAKASGLSEEQALQVANKYIAETGQQTGWYGEGAAQGKNWSVAVQEAIDKLVLENAAKTANTDSRGIPLAKNPPNDQPDHATPAKPDNTTHDPIAPVTPSPITSAKSYDVNITLGGNQTTIHTSSDADAQALIAVLQRAKLTA